MTVNERRILTLLSKQGPLTKQEMVQRGGMSWATAVKMVGRLQEAGILLCTGSKPSSGRKPAYLYDLAADRPLALGIDVEYSTTTLVLSNLKNEVLVSEAISTPQQPTDRELQQFLYRQARSFIRRHVPGTSSLAGIGLGLPLRLFRYRIELFHDFAQALGQMLKLTVRVDNNVRTYTMYRKWVGQAFPHNNFVVVSIRGGVGTGIYYQGNLMKGEQGLAGELGHLIIEEGGQRCRCGKRGCLETLVNQRELYQDYCSRVRKIPLPANSWPDREEIRRGLSELFRRVKGGEADAVAVVERAALFLGRALVQLLLVLNIRQLILAGHFGPDGDAFIPFLEEVMRPRLFPESEFSLSYVPLEQLSFAQGASLLVLKDFLTEVG